MLFNNYCIFGKSGSGKTSFVNQKLLSILPIENVFAVDFKQTLKVLQQNRRATIETLLMEAKSRKNSMFIIDDATGLLRAGNSNIVNDFLFLLNTARHDNNFYIFVFHGVKFFPEAFTSGIHAFIFFAIDDTTKQIEGKVPIFDKDELKAATMKKRKYVYPSFLGGEFAAIYKNK